ncbi:toprim domain-containing protein [Leuconostoc gasicomitatum]|uniref:toprim domain-containing protein n=1 Tax=Leuconostoc gasicomitatum TaxID=115778 RepID=UPI0007E0F81C|nr:toprim domain-containing protein [Leuconostoc gasicomitatum]CUW11363.1 LtrC-like protein [Leuconostoc gasicomitatum]
MRISPAERVELKKLPIKGYCDWKGIPYNQNSASEIRMVDHDSLVVRPKLNQFVWNSTGIKGDLVDFIHFYELKKTEGDSKGPAIKNQLAYARYVKGEHIDLDKLNEAGNISRQKFSYDKVFRTKETNIAKNYLVNDRQLNKNFVNNLFKQGLIAQGSRYRENDVMQPNSVIFPWRNVSGEVVGGDRQGTQKDFVHHKKRGTTKQVLGGSDTSTGFNLAFGTGDKTLVLFESPVDLLSYAQQNHQDMVKNNATLLSISGTDAKRGAKYLNEAIAKNNAPINKIVVAFDNDKAGFKAADFYDRFQFKNPVTGEKIVAERQIPVKGKDWNDQLKSGISGFRSLTMSENSKRLSALEQVTVLDGQQNPFEDTRATHLSAEKPREYEKETKPKTKAQRRKDNLAKNKVIIQSAIAQVTRYQTDPKSLQKLLDFTATGLDYSARNSMLIHLQRPEATLVKGYKQWAANGIQVNKGETGVKIFGAPVSLKTIVDSNGERTYWRDATPEQKQLAESKKMEVQTIKHFPIQTVFDVRQTDATAAQLPELLPNRPIDLKTDHSPKHLDNAYQTLVKYAEKMKISVIDKGVDDQLAKKPVTWQGQPKGAIMQSKVDPSKRAIYLRSDLTPTDKIHTLSHELGHAKLHDIRRGEQWPTAVKETQAELTGYTISKSLGIEPGENSVRYIEGWSKQLNTFESQDAGRILREALQASTDVTQYLSDNLSKGEQKAVKTTKLIKPDQSAVVEENYQAFNQTNQKAQTNQKSLKR